MSRKYNNMFKPVSAAFEGIEPVEPETVDPIPEEEPVELPPVPQGPAHVRVAYCRSVNVRQKAQKGSKVLAILPKGTTLTRTINQGAWSYVHNQDKSVSGFIMSEFLEEV